MSRFKLAQLNVAKARGPMDSPVMAEFVANLERVNALAEAAQGFVWRLKTDAGDATSLRPLGEDMLVNMSVWDSPDDLSNFMFRTAHVETMKRRREWFERMEEAYAVLWWVPAGHIPSLDEAILKLQKLRADGPTPEAFTLRRAFPPPGEQLEEVPTDISFGDNVRILRTAETERLGIAERVGNVYGETTPSDSKVAVIGRLDSDYALNVYFDTLDASYWFAPHMLEFVNHAPGTEVHVHGSAFKSVRQRDGTWKDVPLDAGTTPWPGRLLRWLRDRVGPK